MNKTISILLSIIALQIFFSCGSKQISGRPQMMQTALLEVMVTDSNDVIGDVLHCCQSYGAASLDSIEDAERGNESLRLVVRLSYPDKSTILKAFHELEKMSNVLKCTIENT